VYDERRPIKWFDRSGHLNWFLGRVLEQLLLKSEPSSDSNVTGSRDHPKTNIDRLLAALSFGIFSMYHSYVQKIWFDGVITNGEWDLFRGTLTSELADSNLLATVLLAANVGFLALQHTSSSETTISIISTILSVASIVSGTHNATKHRILHSRRFFHPEAADTYFLAASFRGFDESLRILAICLALPSSLLLWSLVSFISALAAFTFSRKWSTASNLPPAIMLVMVTLLVSLALGLFGYIFLKSDPDENDEEVGVVSFVHFPS